MPLATTFPFNSLTARIVCVTAFILALAGTLIGWALYDTVRRSVQVELQSQLDLRIAWLRSTVELDEVKLDFESKLPLSNLPQNWRITTVDGKVLWQTPETSTWAENDATFVNRSQTVELGDLNGPRLSAADIQPAATASGNPFGSYSTGEKRGKLLLILMVREPVANSEKELHRVALALWTIGPVSILGLASILAFFIRWQHAPLKSMSLQASKIGPENTDNRIGPVGSSIEFTRLRDAINSMVNRMADGMRRERQFSSMAAHELRTPLTQLRLNVEIALSKARGQAEYKETLAQSLLDIERLQNLVANLLFLTREYSGPEMRREVALHETFEQAAKSCGSDALIRSDLRSVSVLGNSELLRCAARNVLENAMRYAPGAPAEVTLSAVENHLEIQITDSGPGVPTKDCERIFEPLMRLDDARTIGGETDGFGLGLTVARNAVRACGGDLVCKPRPDGKRGAMFVFTFQRSATLPKNGDKDEHLTGGAGA